MCILLLYFIPKIIISSFTVSTLDKGIAVDRALGGCSNWQSICFQLTEQNQIISRCHWTVSSTINYELEEHVLCEKIAMNPQGVFNFRCKLSSPKFIVYSRTSLRRTPLGTDQCVRQRGVRLKEVLKSIDI